ncbi:protein nessun dorma [Anopheles ziemanni]|uniref:protein nessun dorma n=1 Tax=Anopheles ziemanni TaxID=345580 RepID=UPI00265828A1|nr:protein nessun dorma isoform X1 [Anopheles coustani]XP_058124091.1 protein nessun dorma isoform X1 [Anopheles coustani]XP_058168327.1 protein nessun dorma [Anopheles ziemanni]XP_058168328.1 protein nessun dorma [Anopheles ziemanni]
MDVYEFKKTYLTRLLETSNVLNGGGASIPASAIRSEWINFVEVAVEPTGWQALWKASRPVCEQLCVKYPLVVLGTVDQVLFDELKATFLIEAILDDDVHLPEDKITVDLEELWPLREQNNPALNVNITADCIDKLRFFYQHLWMPWDVDIEDDHSWVAKHLDTRIRFSYDLKNKTMSRQLSSHALALLAESRYIQRKRELLELEIGEEDQDDEDDADNETSLMADNRAGELLQLNLRLNTIKNEISILENPVMRSVFEKLRFGNEKGKESTRMAYIVTQAGTIDEQLRYLADAKAMMDQKMLVKMCDSLQHALDHCSPDSVVYLPPGTRQDIKFLEYLNNDGSFRGVSDSLFIGDFDEASKTNPIIASKDDDSVLLTIDGDFTLENIKLDCSNVRTGVVIKKGNVTFRNCCFTGDPSSSTKQGIVIFGNCNITFDRCLIKEFATGIYSNHDCTISLLDTTISHCMTGLEMLDQCRVLFRSTRVLNSAQYGVLLEDFNDAEDNHHSDNQSNSSSQIFEDFNTVEREEFTFDGNCEFRGNVKGNFAIRKGCTDRFNSSCFVDEDERSSESADPDDSQQEEPSACNATNVSFSADFLENTNLSSTKHASKKLSNDRSNHHYSAESHEDRSTSDTGVSSSLTHTDDESLAENETIDVQELKGNKYLVKQASEPEESTDESTENQSDQIIEIEDTIIEID